jgi:hypothetical protein
MPWIEANVSFNSFFDRAATNVRVRGCEAQFDKALRIVVFIAAAHVLKPSCSEQSGNVSLWPFSTVVAGSHVWSLLG